MSDSDLTPSIVPKDEDQVANATPSPKQSDLHAAMAMAARLEQANARAYQLARKRVRVDDAAQHPSNNRQTPVDTFRAAIPGERPSLDGPALRILFGFLLAACICVAAIAWLLSYSNAFMIGGRSSQFTQSPSLPPEKPELPAQPSSPIVQVDAAKAALPQPAPVAETEVKEVALNSAGQPADLPGLLQSIVRHLATVTQEIKQLKSSQQQMAGDNAKIAEQLKASQEQLAAVIANASEQNVRPRRSAPPPQPIPTPTQERAVILGVLTDNKGPMTPTELAIATGQANRNIRQLLYKMAKSGEIFKYGRARYGLQPNAGNNDKANSSGPVPALPSPQATQLPETEKQLSSPPPIPVR